MSKPVLCNLICPSIDQKKSYQVETNNYPLCQLLKWKKNKTFAAFFPFLNILHIFCTVFSTDEEDLVFQNEILFILFESLSFRY